MQLDETTTRIMNKRFVATKRRHPCFATRVLDARIDARAHRRARTFATFWRVDMRRQPDDIGAADALERHRPPGLLLVDAPTTTTITTTGDARATRETPVSRATSTSARASAPARRGGGGRAVETSSSADGQRPKTTDEDDARAMGKSAARVRVERALGGAFEYRVVVARAVEAVEEAFETRAEARAKDGGGGDAGWRAFDDDETRAFAVDVRREIERSMRVIEDEIQGEFASRERAVRPMERETTSTATAREAARATTTTRRRTGVAFGTTVRAR